MRHILLGLPLILLLAAAGPPRQAASTPVALTPQPGSTLDRAARLLLAEDLADAKARGEKPLVLVGSAMLGSASDRPALFVQLQSARMCGSGGCSSSLFLWRNGHYELVLDGVGGTIAVSAHKTRGMADLIGADSRYVWTGKEYRDTRPAPAIDLRPHRR